MANHGLTPEQFEILFGDTIRREIEMMAAQEQAEAPPATPTDVAPAAAPEVPEVPPAVAPEAPPAAGTSVVPAAWEPPTPPPVPPTPPVEASGVAPGVFAPPTVDAFSPPTTPPEVPSAVAPEVPTVPPSVPPQVPPAVAPAVAPEVFAAPSVAPAEVPPAVVPAVAPEVFAAPPTVPPASATIEELATVPAVTPQDGPAVGLLAEPTKPVGPITEDEPEEESKRGWLTGLVAIAAMVGFIALAGFIGFQRANDASVANVVTETPGAVDEGGAGVGDGDVADDVDGDDGVDPGDEVEDDEPADEAEAQDAEATADEDAEPDDPEVTTTVADEPDAPEDEQTNDEPEVEEAEPAAAATTVAPEATTAETTTTSTTTTTTTSTTTTTTTTSIPPAAAAGSLIGAVEGRSLCQDPAGDVMLTLDSPEPAFGAPAVVDLVAAELIVSATQVVVRWQTAGEVPANLGQAGESPVEVGSYTATLWSEDPTIISAEEPIRRVNLIADIDFGEIAALVTGTGPSLQNAQRTGTVTFEGDSIVATFAVGDLGALPAEFNWTATVRTGLVDNPAAPQNFGVAQDDACPSFNDFGERFLG